MRAARYLIAGFAVVVIAPLAVLALYHETCCPRCRAMREIRAAANPRRG